MVKAYQDPKELVYELRAVQVLYRVFSDAGRLDLTALQLARACLGWPVLRLREDTAQAPDSSSSSGATIVTDEALLYRRFDGDLAAALARPRLGGAAFRALLVAGLRSFLRFCAILHAAGYLHLDAKLANMLVRGRASAPEVVVGDYGLLAAIADVQSNGTPIYMSPVLPMHAHEAKHSGLREQRRDLWKLIDPQLTVYGAYLRTAQRGQAQAQAQAQLAEPGVIDLHAMGASMLHLAQRLPQAARERPFKRDLLLSAARLLMLSPDPGGPLDEGAAQREARLDQALPPAPDRMPPSPSASTVRLTRGRYPAAHPARSGSGSGSRTG